MYALFQDSNDYIFITASNRTDLVNKINSVHDLLDKNHIEVDEFMNFEPRKITQEELLTEHPELKYKIQIDLNKEHKKFKEKQKLQSAKQFFDFSLFVLHTFPV